MDILTVPNKLLTTRCDPVTNFNGELLDFCRDLVATAEMNNLVGLAGNQVGVLSRVFVMRDLDAWFTCVNPVLKFNPKHGESWDYEGCASIPNRQGMVKRCNSVALTAQNESGESFAKDLTGIQARIAQHEMDHLNGVLLTSAGKVRQWQYIKT